MKPLKFTLLTFLFVLNSISQPLYADEDYRERLYYLCKFWGYVKYFHSEVSDQNCLVEWDDELLLRIPEVKAATSDEEFNQILLTMLETAGPMLISAAEAPNIPEELKINLELDWLSDPFFNSIVQTKLQEINERFRPHPLCRIESVFSGGNINFEEDNAYWNDQGNYPDEAHRLLAMFRYWNVIKYWFPYHHLMDQHWDTTLVQFIPSIVEASGDYDYHLTFKEFTTYIYDSHAFFNSAVYFSQVRGVAHPPFQTHFIENEMVVTKTLNHSGLKKGDIIKKIGGKDIYELRDSFRRYIHGSNPITTDRNLNSFLEWGPPGTMELEVENENGAMIYLVDRNSSNFSSLNNMSNEPVWQDTITPGGCHYGYVNMGRLEQNQVDALFTDLRQTDAIIVDIRNYPNGTLWTMVNYLYPGSIEVADFTVPDARHAGVVSWSEVSLGQGAPSPYKGRLLILFNEDTQSQAEYTIMGLEPHPGSVKIGSQTAAADGNVSSVFLPGNIQAYFTNLGTYYPDRTETQRVGIVPDIEVRPTIEGVRDGIDEVLNAAFAVELDCPGPNESITEPWIIAKPNPFQNQLTLEIINFGSPVRMQLIDVSGKLILEEIAQEEIELDLSALPSGVYFIKAKNDNYSAVQKLVKR